jgi:threonine/homoserine/homoserine lactone efflux protein
MSLQTWWLFVGMTFVVSATPGPNMMLVMSHGARFGWRRAVMTMAGCMTALLAMMSVSAAGLGALLGSFPTVFNALRYLGAAYLAYLGVQLFRSAGGPESATDADLSDGSARTGVALYRQGLAVAASNPKAIVFAAAFFPQFIQSDAPALPQFGLLLATFTVIEVGWYGVYAVSGHKLSRYLQNAKVLGRFNRMTGGVFVAFAALMAFGR